MRKKLKEHISPFTLLLIITLTFALFQPRISSVIPQKRDHALKQFINSSLQSGQINSEEYWKFREFYYPGTFTFNENGIKESNLDTDLKKLLPQGNSNYIFLKYQSKYLKSIDVLTDTKNLRNLFKNHTILANKNNLIFNRGDSTVIVLLRNNEEMQKVNGFLKYKDRDKNLIKGKQWLSITIINP